MRRTYAWTYRIVEFVRTREQEGLGGLTPGGDIGGYVEEQEACEVEHVHVDGKCGSIRCAWEEADFDELPCSRTAITGINKNARDT